MFVIENNSPTVSANDVNKVRVFSDVMIVLTYPGSSWIEIAALGLNQNLCIKRNQINKQTYPGKQSEVKGLNENAIDGFVQKFLSRGAERELARLFGGNRWLFYAEMLNAGMTNKLDLKKITSVWEKSAFLGSLAKFINTASTTTAPALVGSFAPKAWTANGITTDDSPGAGPGEQPQIVPVNTVTTPSPTAAVGAFAG